VSPSSSGPARIVAVVGLAREARIAASPAVHPVIGGGAGARLTGALERAVADGARAIISFGIAGGLDPVLAAGACIVGSAATVGVARWPTDPDWTEKLVTGLPGAILADVASVDHPIVSVAHKRLLRAAGGAAAVDMESYRAARVAAAHGLPFAILRIVCDPANRALPPAALVGMRNDGTSDVGAVLHALIGGPGQIPDLIRLALDARVAFAQLKHRRDSLDPNFALVNTFPRPLDGGEDL
jgi:adenosylhomocysteine nucleosidase